MYARLPIETGFLIVIPMCPLFSLRGLILRHFETPNKEKGGDFMAVNFFEREVKKIQKRFNETFGRQIVCNLDVRYSAILSICWLGILSRKINRAKDKEKAKDNISEFVKIRDVLNNVFNLIEKDQERRGYVHRRKDSHDTDDGQRRGRSLPELR